MKCLLLMLFTLFWLPAAPAQTFALNDAVTRVMPSSGSTFYTHNAMNKNKVMGAVMAGCGGLSAGMGGLIYLFTMPHGDHPVDNSIGQAAGITLLIGGAAMLISGGILAESGRNESKAQYGLKIIAPRYNEIGIAYNFK